MTGSDALIGAISISDALGGLIDYSTVVLNIEPANLIAYWKLDETTGTVITDSSGNGCHGVASGVTLHNDAGIDGGGAPWFNGTSSYINIYSTALRDLFNSAEGTVMIWTKVNSVSVYADGEMRDPIMLRANANNYAQLKKNISVFGDYIHNYNANGTVESPYIVLVSDVTWMCHAMTWSVAADEVKGYIDGVQFDTTKTSLGTWTGQLASGWCAIGCDLINSAQWWHGWLQHAAVWSKPLTQAQLTVLANIPASSHLAISDAIIGSVAIGDTDNG